MFREPHRPAEFTRQLLTSPGLLLRKIAHSIAPPIWFSPDARPGVRGCGRGVGWQASRRCRSYSSRATQRNCFAAVVAAGWRLPHRQISARPQAAADTRAGPEKPIYQSISEEYAVSDRNWDTIDTVVRIAKKIGATAAQVALSWIAPIVGARTVEHLRGNLAAADLTLDSDVTAELEKVSAPQPGGYPYGALWTMAAPTLDA
jgi:Aldo/keto reductase family